MSAPFTISVVIPAYNEEKYIEQTLKSVLESVQENLLEIIVVNNASTDRTEQVASQFPKVRVIDEPQKGLTRARQAGLEAARGDVLAYLDADTRISKSWFNILFAEFAKDSRLVCLSGPYHYYDLPQNNHAIGKFWNSAWIKIWHWFIDRITVVPGGYVIMGGNFAAKKTALLAAGGFNPDIEFYGEDTDIARRLYKVGKIKFLNEFWVASSARRFTEEGLIRTAIKYLLNYLSIIILKKPATSRYSDVR